MTEELFIPKVNFYDDGSGNMTCTIIIPREWLLDDEAIKAGDVIGVTLHYQKNKHYFRQKLRGPSEP